MPPYRIAGTRAFGICRAQFAGSVRTSLHTRSPGPGNRQRRRQATSSCVLTMPPRNANANAMAGPSQPQDELTQTVFGAVESLSQVRKAGFLLETSLALIESGR